jgi:hypothetical protein
METKDQKPALKSSKMTFCDQYEKLLSLCQKALETWATRREQAWQMGLRGKELGGELIRLQANFAKSYAVLQQHTRECPLCELVGQARDRGAATPYLVTAQTPASLPS